MTKTVRILRVALPVAFVAFLAVLGLSYRSNQRQPQKAGTPIGATPRANDKPRSVATAFEDTQSIGGKVAFKISAERQISFESGWHTLEGVRLTIFRGGGTTYEVSAKQAQFHAETRRAEATGGVEVKSSDGLLLRTSSLRYDGAKLTNDQPVEFAALHWHGQAQGFDVSLNDQTVVLSKVQASGTPPQPGELPMSIVADEATLRHKAGEAWFRGNALLTRGNDRMAADQMVARVDSERKKLTGMEGAGNVRMTISGSSPLVREAKGAVVGRTNVVAKRFIAHFTEGGVLAAFLLAGEETLAVATMAGPPQRTLQAHNLRFLFSNGGISELQAENDFLLKEEAREIRSVNARGYFDPMTGDPRSLVAEINVTFRDGVRQGKADRATYEFVSRKVTLLSGPTGGAAMTSPSEALRAQTIEIFGTDESLKATGTVMAQMNPKKETSASDTALFPEKGPVFVNADSAFFRKADESGTFSGNVRAWQGTNAILSRELLIRGAGESISATGGVRASFTNVKSAKKTTMLARGDRMTSKKTDRRLELEGNARIDDETRSLQANKAIVFLDQKQKIERVEGIGNVVITETATGRKGTGDHAIYRLQQRVVTFEGSPATITDPQGTIRGKQIIADLEKNKVEVVSGTTPTEATYNPQ